MSEALGAAEAVVLPSTASTMAAATLYAPCQWLGFMAALWRPTDHRHPYASAMPAFGATLSDADIAEIVDYERGSWGNHGSFVSTDRVAKERLRSE